MGGKKNPSTLFLFSFISRKPTKRPVSTTQHRSFMHWSTNGSLNMIRNHRKLLGSKSNAVRIFIPPIHACVWNSWVSFYLLFVFFSPKIFFTEKSAALFAPLPIWINVSWIKGRRCYVAFTYIFNLSTLYHRTYTNCLSDRKDKHFGTSPKCCGLNLQLVQGAFEKLAKNAHLLTQVGPTCVTWRRLCESCA